MRPLTKKRDKIQNSLERTNLMEDGYGLKSKVVARSWRNMNSSKVFLNLKSVSQNGCGASYAPTFHNSLLNSVFQPKLHLKFICWTRIIADASREHQVSVIANFMCQPDQPVCLDYILFLDVSVTVFLDKISIFISGLSKLLSRMWVGILRSVESLNRTKGRGRKNYLFFPASLLSWDIISSSALRLGFTPLVSLVLWPSDLDWVILTFLGLQ